MNPATSKTELVVTIVSSYQALTNATNTTSLDIAHILITPIFEENPHLSSCVISA